MSAPATSTKHDVLLLAYEGMDTLDWAGPLEIFHQARALDTNEPIFHIAVATVSTHPSPTSPQPVHTVGGGIIVPHIHIDISTVTPADLQKYSIMVIPGAWPESLVPVVSDAQNPVASLIRAFTSLPPLEDSRGGKERILLTICTGSFFLPASGVLRRPSGSSEDSEVPIVTWHGARSQLRSLAQTPSFGCHAKVLEEKRFVDAGILEAGVRLVTSGGVTCGMDATLYVIERLAGREAALGSAGMLEYRWNRSEGILGSDMV